MVLSIEDYRALGGGTVADALRGLADDGGGAARGVDREGDRRSRAFASTRRRDVRLRYLLDTGAASQMGRSRAPERVTRWLGSVHDDDLAMSVLSAREIRRGIELIRARDPLAAGALVARLAELVRGLGPRLIGVDDAIAERWGRISAGREPVPAIDGVIAATAIEHGLAVVTRNERDFARFGVPVVNPWAES